MSVANLKKRAKRLLRDARSGSQPSIWRFKKLHPEFTNQALDEIFESNWQTDTLCQIQAGQSRFLIQDFYEPEYANNCMYQLMVDDVEAIWEQLRDSGLLNRHGDVRATPPKKEDWGTVVYLWGPGGELWHITESHPTAA